MGKESQSKTLDEITSLLEEMKSYYYKGEYFATLIHAGALADKIHIFELQMEDLNGRIHS